jgi:hypothetical protein
MKTRVDVDDLVLMEEPAPHAALPSARWRGRSDVRQVRGE